MPCIRLFLFILPAILLVAGGAAAREDPLRPKLAQAAPASGISAPEKQAIAEAVVEAFSGIRIYENGAVEDLAGKDLSDPEGMPPGLANYVSDRKQLPPGLQQLIIDAVELRLPQRRAQVAGLSLILRDPKAGAIVGIVSDVLALRRSQGQRG